MCAQRDAVQPARYERVLAFDAERSGAVEAATRAGGRDARDARQRPVERPVEHAKPAALQGVQLEAAPWLERARRVAIAA